MVLWSSESSTESSYNGVPGIGLDNPETGCDGSSAGNVDVGMGIDECVHTDEGREAAYSRGTTFSKMGGYDFPGQIAGSDGSEGNGTMGTGFIVLWKSVSTGSIRVVRTEEGTDSTREEITDLLEVLIGTNVTENLVVMVDNQSILRKISRWPRGSS